MEEVHWPNENHASFPPVFFGDAVLRRGFGTGLALRHRWQVSRGVPGSHYQIVTQTPSALSGGFSCYKGRGITCGVHSFLSLAT